MTPGEWLMFCWCFSFLDTFIMETKTILATCHVKEYFGKQWRPRWNAAYCCISSGSALFAKIKTTSRTKIHHSHTLENSTCDPFKCTMGNPILVVSIFFSKRSYFCIVTSWSDKCCLSHGMCLYQVIMTLHFLNDVVNDIESTRKSIITSKLLVWTVNQLVNW